jgi:hypothetical protein
MAQMTLDSPPREGLKIEVVVEADGTFRPSESRYLEKHICKLKPNELIVKDSNSTADSSLARIEASTPPSSSSFVIDTVGGQPVQTGFPPPRLRSVSPSRSSSSEEVILFSGRKTLGKPRCVQPSEAPVDSIDEKIRVVEEKIHEREELLTKFIQPTNSVDFESILSKKGGRGSRGDKDSRKSRKQQEEDALIADYLQNMDDDNFAASVSFNQRELGGEEALWQDEHKASSEESLLVPKLRSQDGWDRADIFDFDDMSTSDGVMGEIQAILSKRERESGLQVRSQ